jgi:hypothetical protein
VKLLRRLIFGFLCVLIVAPVIEFSYAFNFPHSGNFVLFLASVAVPAQALAAFAMLIWCAIFLKVEPGLSRIGILLAALAILLVGLVDG